MPLSEGSNAKEVEKFMSGVKKLTLDVTENRIQRPQD